MLDLDYLKTINDRFGDLSGDNVLKSLGLLLKQRLRAIDIAGRYEGKVMVILLPDTSAVQAEQLVADLLQNFSEIYSIVMAANFPLHLVPVLPSILVLRVLQAWRRQPIRLCIVLKRKAESNMPVLRR